MNKNNNCSTCNSGNLIEFPFININKFGNCVTCIISTTLLSFFGLLFTYLQYYVFIPAPEWTKVGTLWLTIFAISLFTVHIIVLIVRILLNLNKYLESKTK